MTKLETRRVYDAPSDGDGFRVLVDRLWPRGLAKDKARVDLWAKEIAPSDELRKAFGHEADRWDDFRERYEAELRDNAEAVKSVVDELRKHRRVTLLYGAHETRFNNAVVLEEHLGKLLAKDKR
ncbi:MAG TPA: DUF488 family protein [Burkholderiaceae bacterium]|nr:DUF488 family protein [Burkholderiaceae bacterium]